MPIRAAIYLRVSSPNQAEAAAGSVQMQWGWALLVIGSVLLMVAGVATRSSFAITQKQ